MGTQRKSTLRRAAGGGIALGFLLHLFFHFLMPMPFEVSRKRVEESRARMMAELLPRNPDAASARPALFPGHLPPRFGAFPSEEEMARLGASLSVPEGQSPIPQLRLVRLSIQLRARFAGDELIPGQADLLECRESAKPCRR
jgi:hypothetical protein